MRLLVIGALLALGACASLPERPPVANPAAVWEVRQMRLAHVNGWDLRGRLALRTDDEGANASLRWVRSRERYRMNLVGPFGGGRVSLTYDGRGAELRDADGNTHWGASMQKLLLRETGWHLPIEGLHYWILGLPDPQAKAHRTLDQWGRLESLQQLGWNIRFVEYTRAGSYELPRRVFIRHEPTGPADVEIEARLVVENWKISDDAVGGVAQYRASAPTSSH
jgi:outer membrane lipoprotein LolB